MSMGSIGAYKGKRAAHKTALKVNVIEMQEKNQIKEATENEEAMTP